MYWILSFDRTVNIIFLICCISLKLSIWDDLIRWVNMLLRALLVPIVNIIASIARITLEFSSNFDLLLWYNGFSS